MLQFYIFLKKSHISKVVILSFNVLTKNYVKCRDKAWSALTIAILKVISCFYVCMYTRPHSPMDL